MQNRNNLIIVFIIFLVFLLLVFLLFKLPVFNSFSSIAQNIFAPSGNFLNSVLNFGKNKDFENLRNENLDLAKRLIDQEKLILDNKALRDQFETTKIDSSLLVEADIVGSPSFVPGVSVPEYLIINKGVKEGVKEGQAVIYKDNLVGRINKVNGSYSKVILIYSPEFRITAKTLSNESIGIVIGQGGQDLIFGNVLLSDELKVNDLVVSKGDVNEKGIGILPNLILGKIATVSRNPADLFQAAKLKPMLDFNRLNKIFVIKQ